MSPPLHILHVTRDFAPKSNGGLGLAVNGLARAQVHAGMTCSVLSFDNYRPFAKEGMQAEPESTTLPSGLHLIRLRSAAALPRAMERSVDRRPDIIHVHHGLLWSFGAAVAKNLGAPTIFTVHVLQSEQDRLRGIESTQSSRAQATALEECSIVHAPSEAVRDLLASEFPSVMNKLRVIRLGHDDWPHAQKAYDQKRFGPEPLLLYVGRFADINGFGQLLEALPDVLHAHPTLRVTIAGGLPDNAKSERRWKKRWRDAAGVNSDRVEFAGWIDRDELAKLYAEASMLIVPSWFETFGQVALEGMLHGTPLVATTAGALRELVDETTCHVIEAKSTAAIRDAVSAVLSDPELANAQRIAARSQVAEGQHWHDRIDEFDAMYREAFLR